MASRSSWFDRVILPGFAFKAVVIGGGYATGRELAAFFLPSGPQGGLMAMALATVIWSVVASLTFLFAFDWQARDYRTFFQRLLGPAWPVFEVAYLAAIVVILAVFAAAAGAIGKAVLGAPEIAGSLALMAGIVVAVTAGNAAVERLFKWVTVFLYAVYAVFVVFCLSRFGSLTLAALAKPQPAPGWVLGGATYAGYNIIGAIVILPALRHMRSRRDAVLAGLLAGPFAMLPALLFFICMVGFLPQIAGQTLPSDYMLGRIGLPVFRIVFQAMIFAALLESGTGAVHAINERVSKALCDRRGVGLTRLQRLAITVGVLIAAVFVAGWFGLVALIAGGYRWLAYVFLAIYVAPLLVAGASRLWRPAAPLTPNGEELAP
jgi:uncharacterized membrane protein YkvI